MNYGPVISINQNGLGALYSPQIGEYFFTQDFGRSWTPAKKTIRHYHLVNQLIISKSGLGLSASLEGIAVTTDFGQNWTLKVQGVNALSVCISEAQIGLVGCMKGILYNTTDNGETWHQTYLGVNGAITSLGFTDTNSCYLLVTGIAGDPNLTQDQIRETAYYIWNENRQYLEFPDYYSAYKDYNSNDYWMLAEQKLSQKSMVQYSSDNGHTWEISWAPNNIRLTSFGLHNKLIAIISNNKIYYQQKSDWIAVTAPNAVWEILLISELIWLCPTEDSFARTTNGGLDWKVESPGVGFNLVSGTCFINENRGFSTSGNYSGTFSVAETTNAGEDWKHIYIHNR